MNPLEPLLRYLAEDLGPVPTAVVAARIGHDALRATERCGILTVSPEPADTYTCVGIGGPECPRELSPTGDPRFPWTAVCKNRDYDCGTVHLTAADVTQHQVSRPAIARLLRDGLGLFGTQALQGELMLLGRRVCERGDQDVHLSLTPTVTRASHARFLLDVERIDRVGLPALVLVPLRRALERDWLSRFGPGAIVEVWGLDEILTLIRDPQPSIVVRPRSAPASISLSLSSLPSAPPANRTVPSSMPPPGPALVALAAPSITPAMLIDDDGIRGITMQEYRRLIVDPWKDFHFLLDLLTPYKSGFRAYIVKSEGLGSPRDAASPRLSKGAGVLLGRLAELRRPAMDSDLIRADDDAEVRADQAVRVLTLARKVIDRQDEEGWHLLHSTAANKSASLPARVFWRPRVWMKWAILRPRLPGDPA